MHALGACSPSVMRCSRRCEPSAGNHTPGSGGVWPLFPWFVFFVLRLLFLTEQEASRLLCPGRCYPVERIHCTVSVQSGNQNRPGGEEKNPFPLLVLSLHLLLCSLCRKKRPRFCYSFTITPCHSSRPADRTAMKCSRPASPIHLLFLLLFIVDFQVCRSDFSRIWKRKLASPPLGSVVLNVSGNVYPLGYAPASISALLLCRYR